ncbi:MAG: hypothetical protein KY460_03880 [Actinobacteria bacterium]|nr:hypothetical protein [Actinomycetota bacterium]
MVVARVRTVTAVTGWLAAIGLDDATPAGRARAREAERLRMAGRVISLRALAGRIEGRVQGSHARPHLVELGVALWTPEQWRAVADLLARQARHYARLLAGQLPEQFDAALTELGLSLLPLPDQWQLHCTCGEPSPCVHQVAVWLATRERRTADPYLMTRLRGRSREQLLTEIRDRRTGQHRHATPLTELATDGWSHAHVHPSDVPLPPVGRPAISAGPLRMLGDPVGWAGPAAAVTMFGPTIEAAARHAWTLLEGPDVASGDVL